jgi:hypothetical protein
MLDHRAQAGRHPLSERGLDVYETPPDAVDALLRIERLPHRIWEPACGPGAIVLALRAAGFSVRATDIADYGCPNSTARIDFLLERTAADCEAILTNPPYRLAAEFVTHALTMCPLSSCCCGWRSWKVKGAARFLTAAALRAFMFFVGGYR